jgi:hypothetical protein
MNIKGVDNLTPEEIRDAVDQGAVFVTYSYCISLLLVSFRRSSDIYFIKPGKSLLLPGIPFNLISFLIGWWGFPWGIFYTLQSLTVNLSGGTEVTDEVLAFIDPLDLEEAEDGPPPLIPESPLRRKMPSRFSGVVRLVALLVVVVALVWAVFFREQ